MLARSFYEEALAMAREVGDQWSIASGLKDLAQTARDQGEYVSASLLLQQSLPHYREVGDKAGIAMWIEGFAGLAAIQEQAERAARLFGAGEALREAAGSPVAGRPDADLIALSRAALGEGVFAAAWAEGRAMTLEAAVADALEEAPQA
jgi:hypothetical protein